MRSKEEAIKIANKLKELNVIDGYDLKRRMDYLRGYDYLSCELSDYYPNIHSEIKKLLKDKKTSELYEDYDFRLMIKIYYTDDEEERKKQELKDTLKELFEEEV